jgi:hypothetical protein
MNRFALVHKPLVNIPMTDEEKLQRREELLHPPKPEEPPKPRHNIEHPVPTETYIQSNQTYIRKKLFTYEDSLARIKEAGYDRHLRAPEVFRLIRRLYSPTGLTDREREIADNIAEGNGNTGEWLDHAYTLTRSGDVYKLCLYTGLSGIVWQNDHYVNTRKFAYEKKMYAQIDVPEIVASNLATIHMEDLHRKNPELLHYFWGDNFELTNYGVQTTSRLILNTLEDRIHPLFINNLNIVSHFVEQNASRGYRPEISHDPDLTPRPKPSNGMIKAKNRLMEHIKKQQAYRRKMKKP